MQTKSWSIASITVLALTLVTSAVLCVYAVIFSSYERKVSFEKLSAKSDLYVNQLSKAIALPLWNYDSDQLSDVLESQMSDPEIYSVYIVEKGSSVIKIGKARDLRWNVVNTAKIPLSGNYISKSRPVYYDNTLLGYVYIFITDKFLKNELFQKFISLVILIITVEILLVLGLFFTLWKTVIRPIKTIETYAVNVISNPLKPYNEKGTPYFGELFTLHSSIKQMVDILNQRFEELQETERKFRVLFEKTPIAVWLADISGVVEHLKELEAKGITDIDEYFENNHDEVYRCWASFQIVEVNGALYELFKVKNEEELIANKHLLYNNSPICVLKSGLISIWNNEKGIETESELKTLSDELRYVILKWSLLTPSVSSTLLLITLNDITNQKEYEMILAENETKLQAKNEEFYSLNEELSESYERISKINQELTLAKEKAEESDQLKTAFLCNLSHEIRTPLNAIIGFTDLLREEAYISGKSSEFISIIISSSNQLLSIVTDILTISSIQTGLEAVNIRPMELNKVLDELYALYSPKTAEKKLTLLLRKEIDVPGFRILTDETKIIQILTNLLNNAIKFTPAGSIEFGYGLQASTIELYVKDTGIGISESVQGAIFERFRQADMSVSANYGGTGLGLSISKAFAEMLGGSIGVQSQENKGSTFTLSLPLILNEPENQVSAGYSLDTSLPQSQILVLVAEDEEYNYRLIKEYLSADKFNLIRAKNGKQAVEICEKNTVDIILMDIKMPEMDGVTAFEQIRKLQPKVPVIAQTAYALIHEKQQLLEKGFDDYIAKPIKREELLDKIYQLLYPAIAETRHTD